MNQAYPAQQQQDHAQTGSQSLPQAEAPLPLEIEFWGATDKGRQREGNEDAVYPHSGVDEDLFQPGPEYLDQKGRLLIVADGVGGAQAGSQASRWAIRVAVENYYDRPGQDLSADLRAAIQKANASLFQYLQSTGTQEAGSTMTAAVIHQDKLYVANVGDSRVYLLRNGQLTQLTNDHTLTQQKLERGLIRPDQVEMDPDRSVLTRSMGARSDVQVDVFQAQQLAPGDVVLLCSDGLTDMLSDQEIAQMLERHAPKRATQKLIKAANKRGGFDNISVVVARVGGKGAGGGLLGGLTDGVAGMSRTQKAIVGGLAALVVLACSAMGGWAMWGRNNGGDGKETPGAQPTATRYVEVAPGATATGGSEAQPTQGAQPTDTVKPGAPTSTPKPTTTPMPTPVPTDTRPPDRDGDGIVDGRDECPDTHGILACGGCPESDGDGVCDRDDLCPNDPGEFDGCPDSDDDGIPDNEDLCPDFGGPEDTGGCPPDGDGDDDGDGDGGNGDGGNGNGPGRD